MIGRLTGNIIDKQPPHLMIESAGVGYEIEAPMSTFYALPDLNQQVTLHTHLIVREDAHLLYGFLTLQERRLFRALIKVNGVGPKLAITILSGIDSAAFIECITTENTARLVQLPGIGKKTADRLIIEMRDKLADWNSSSLAPVFEKSSTDSSAIAAHDAISALISLGYDIKKARQTVKNISRPDLTTEGLIRQALQTLASG